MVYAPESFVTKVLVIPRSALERVILAPQNYTAAERSVTVPLSVAENACDWASRRVPPKTIASANASLRSAAICDRVPRMDCIGCASLK